MVMDTDQTKLRELSSFLARMNGDRHHHVGYCGEQEGEVYSTLLEDFSDHGRLNSQRFTVIYDQDQMVGALGFDVDEEEELLKYGGLLSMRKATYGIDWRSSYGVKELRS